METPKFKMGLIIINYSPPGEEQGLVSYCGFHKGYIINGVFH